MTAATVAVAAVIRGGGSAPPTSQPSHHRSLNREGREAIAVQREEREVIANIPKLIADIADIAFQGHRSRRRREPSHRRNHKGTRTRSGQRVHRTIAG
ncbi:MAG TPA: hypothetical protein VLB51_01140 [Methylomirabilota bacterium]|nr:hypothetical protein [Methylomirabilota bacterium]